MPINNLLPGNEQGAVPPVRTEPIQGRSAARIDTLLDAVAAVVDEIGFERLTTAMVSERADASIGTVYRYFPDRIALLQGLRDRAAVRFRMQVVELIREEKPQRWWDAVGCALDAFAQMYRTEPGFRIIRFADTERLDPSADHTYQPEFFAARFGEILSEEYGLPAGDDLDFRLNIVMQIADTLITRAFQQNPDGDANILTETHEIVHAYLAGYYGETGARGA